jgi:hypothetical protein
MEEDTNGRLAGRAQAGPAAAKKAGRPPNRRPKMMPVKMRHRLANLGLAMQSNDTTNDNLRNLIEKLSSDLHNYSIAADHWQKKTLELKAAEEAAQEVSLEEIEDQEVVEMSAVPGFITPGALSAFELDLLRQLKQNQSPTLNMMVMPAPKLISAMKTLQFVTSDETFIQVLSNMSSVGNLFGVFKATPGAWSDITRLKPNFEESRARKIWQCIFTPIDTPISSLEWSSAAASRCGEKHIDPYDPDYDFLDRLLAQSTDLQVLDLLHYGSLLLLGLNHSASDDPLLVEARDHLGRQVERLLHETVVIRNISTNPDFAAEFVCSIVDSIYHYSFQAKNGALGALLEIAWNSCSQFPDAIHPILKAMIVFESTIWAPNNSRRALWMARNEELMKSTDTPYFHLVSTTWFTSCFYALAIRDEESLLYYLSKLDMVLAPDVSETNLDSLDELSAPYADHPTIGVHPVRSGEYPLAQKSPNSSHWNQNRAELDDLWQQYRSETQTPSTSESSSTFIYDNIDTSVSIRDKEAKICLRAAVHFVRAEAAIISQNFPNVFHWLDEAEKEIKKLPNPVLFQRLLLTDIPTFRFAFGTEFHFPTGSRNITQELDRRVQVIVAEWKLKQGQSIPSRPSSH